MSPTHTRRRGRLYRYYVSQAVLKGTADDCPVRRLPAAEIEAAVVDQVRALLRQPEVVVGTWRTARAEAPDLTEAETLAVLERLDPLWDELFPAEQARIVRLLVAAGPEGMSAGAIGEAMDGASSSRMSFHLSHLEQAGLVESRREGRSIIYSATLTTLSGLVEFLMRDCCQGHPEVCNPAMAALSSCCEPTNGASHV